MKIHPLGRVPALKLDDGTPLSENTAILPFLGKRFGLWPLDPVSEAKALSTIGFFASSVHPANAHVTRPERYTDDKAAFPGMQAKGKLALYLHGVKIGVLVDYDGPEEVGTDVAMHISFYKPQFTSKNEVPADVVSRERDIQLARAKESGKPAEIAAKMVEGSLNKFLGEITLMGQPFVKDDKQTVEKMLAAKKGKVNGYAFLVVGEGIEKAPQVH
jgi:elongation factor Ts